MREINEKEGVGGDGVCDCSLVEPLRQQNTLQTSLYIRLYTVCSNYSVKRNKVMYGEPALVLFSFSDSLEVGISL